MFLINERAVAWSCKKQHTVGPFSTEAEYMVVTQKVKQELWPRELLNDMRVSPYYLLTQKLQSDNSLEAAIVLSRNPEYNS